MGYLAVGSASILYFEHAKWQIDEFGLMVKRLVKRLRIKFIIDNFYNIE